MVPARPGRQRGKLLHVFENFLSQNGMFPDFLELLIGKFPLFVDNRFRDSNFPDVVQKSHGIDVLLLFGRFPHAPRNLLCVLGDAE